MHFFCLLKNAEYKGKSMLQRGIWELRRGRVRPPLTFKLNLKEALTRLLVLGVHSGEIETISTRTVGMRTCKKVQRSLSAGLGPLKQSSRGIMMRNIPSNLFAEDPWDTAGRFENIFKQMVRDLLTSLYFEELIFKISSNLSKLSSYAIQCILPFLQWSIASLFPCVILLHYFQCCRSILVCL